MNFGGLLALGKVKQVLVLRWKTWSWCEKGYNGARVETISSDNFGNFGGKVIVLINSDENFGDLFRRVFRFWVVAAGYKCG